MAELISCEDQERTLYEICIYTKSKQCLTIHYDYTLEQKDARSILTYSITAHFGVFQRIRDSLFKIYGNIR